MESESIKRPKERPEYFSYRLLAVFLCLALGIATAGYLLYYWQSQEIKNSAMEELNTIAELKVRQIEQWRSERINDSIVRAENPIAVEILNKWRKNPNSPQVQQKILTWFELVKKTYDYTGAYFIDPKSGRQLPWGGFDFAAHLRADTERVLDNQTAVFSDLHFEENTVCLDILSPVYLKERGRKELVGILIFRVDPNDFLFPLMQEWPTPSHTAETLLVQKSGGDVLFLNELRHIKNTSLRFRIPLTETKVPAVAGVLGREGFFEGKDYRGVPVFSYLKKIPGTQWVMVSKIDKNEVYSAHQANFVLIAALAAIMVLASGLGVAYFWRIQQATFYRRQCEAESAKLMLLQKYEHLTKHASDIILLLDQGGDILEANEKALSSYGYGPDEIRGVNIKTICAPNRPNCLAAVVEGIEAAGHARIETVHRRKDGSTFDVEVSCSAISVEGRLLIMAIIRDVTERKRSEETLRSLYTRYDAILSANPDIILEVDKNKVYTWANKAGYAFFGDDVVGREAAYYFEGQQDTYAAVKPLFDGSDETLYVESLQRRRDGEKRLLAWWCRVLKDAEGKAAGALSTARDITEQKKIEEELNQYRVHLEDLVLSRTRELEDANAKLRELDRLKSMFIASMSHELRTPLNSIIGFSSVLLHEWIGPVSREQKERLSTINRAGQHLLSLINDVIDVSKIEAGMIETFDEDFNLKDLIIEAVDSISHDAESKGLELKVESMSIPMHTDRRRLLQCVLNLVSNAVKFTPKGRVHVRANMGGEGFAEISVDDTGIGIMEDDMPKLFTPFSRFESHQKFIVPGTGLGLYLTKKLLTEVLSGTIEAESEFDRGSRFSIKIPLKLERPS